jgi:hypothetical protein
MLRLCDTNRDSCFSESLQRFAGPRQRGKVIYPLDEVLLVCLALPAARGDSAASRQGAGNAPQSPDSAGLNLANPGSRSRRGPVVVSRSRAWSACLGVGA